MNKLSNADRVRVIKCLVEGCSIRSTVRMIGIAKNTFAKLLIDLGEVCAEYHDTHVRGLKSVAKAVVDQCAVEIRPGILS